MGKLGRPTDGSKLEGTKKKETKKKVISSKVKIRSMEAIESDGYFKCTCCGKSYKGQKGNFLVTNSVLYRGNDGYLTICKNCGEKYYAQLVGFYCNNEAHAMEHLCHQFDWFYSAEALSMSGSSKTQMASPSMYSSKMNMALIQKVGTTYFDTIKIRNEKSGIINGSDELPEAQFDESGELIEAPIDPELIRNFGYGYTRDEYEFLEQEYTDWITRYECRTKAQEELFKCLCMAHLTIQRVQKNGDAKGLAEATKMYQELMQSANIKPNQSKDDAFVESNTFGTLIKMYENEKPIPEPEEAWKDVDNIRKYYNVFFLGHLCNLLHVKNDSETEYRRVMEEFTVKPPVYEGDGMDETSLLDKYSDKADSKLDTEE